MRENADIVMLGEIRDPETTLAAIRLAATGHLVIGTVHSGTAAGTIDRIIESAPKEAQNFYRSLLADNLQAVLAQRLIRIPTGGRVAMHELLITDTTTTALIKGAKTGQLNDTISRSREKGMFTFTQCAAKLVMDGIVDEEEAIRVIGTSREEYDLQREALLNRTKAEPKPITPVEAVKPTPTTPPSWIKKTVGGAKI
jgi:twitching motility protein PilT